MVQLKIKEDSGKNLNLISEWDNLISEIRSLLVQKNEAYGDTWQKFGSAGTFISLSKRYYRIKNLLLNEILPPTNTESVEDSLKDLINEAIFLLILLREENK